MKPMTTARVIERYFEGISTVHGTAGWLLLSIDTESIDSEMALIPDEIMPVFRRLAVGYQPGKMILYGYTQEPTLWQLARIRDWFAKHPVEQPVLEAASVE